MNGEKCSQTIWAKSTFQFLPGLYQQITEVTVVVGRVEIVYLTGVRYTSIIKPVAVVWERRGQPSK
jgi:rRNA maturation protein Rpf1